MYDCNKLIDFCTRVMMDAGLSEEKGRLFAESITYAEMRGISSHGFTRLKTYYTRLKTGLVDAKASAEVEKDLPSLMIVNGNNALGVVSGVQTMNMCIERAEKTGCCFAAVRGGNHFGCASYFAEMATRKGMVGIAMANGPVAVAPINGKQPMLGTNPLAIAIPVEGKKPFVLDMATSVVARGKIKLAEKEGRTIPADWAIDENGEPTTDPSKVKCVLPFGGAKGYGISLFIETMCSCLSGAMNAQTMGSFYNLTPNQKQDSGFFFGVINTKGIYGDSTFMNSTASLFESIKNSEKGDSFPEIFIPGEIEQRNYEKAERDGIKLSDVVAGELKDLAKDCSIEFSCEK